MKRILHTQEGIPGASRPTRGCRNFVWNRRQVFCAVLGPLWEQVGHVAKQVLGFLGHWFCPTSTLVLGFRQTNDKVNEQKGTEVCIRQCICKAVLFPKTRMQIQSFEDLCRVEQVCTHKCAELKAAATSYFFLLAKKCIPFSNATNCGVQYLIEMIQKKDAQSGSKDCCRQKLWNSSSFLKLQIKTPKLRAAGNCFVSVVKPRNWSWGWKAIELGMLPCAQAAGAFWRMFVCSASSA